MKDTLAALAIVAVVGASMGYAIHEVIGIGTGGSTQVGATFNPLLTLPQLQARSARLPRREISIPNTSTSNSISALQNISQAMTATAPITLIDATSGAKYQCTIVAAPAAVITPDTGDGTMPGMPGITLPERGGVI